VKYFTVSTSHNKIFRKIFLFEATSSSCVFRVCYEHI